jgi:hypothetical protein
LGLLSKDYGTVNPKILVSLLFLHFSRL